MTRGVVSLWLTEFVLLCLLAAPLALAQDAIATVEQLRLAASVGGTYTLGAGNFVVPGPLDVTRDLTLIGQGTGVTAIRVGAPPAGLRVLAGATVSISGVDFWRQADDSPSSDLIHVLDGHLVLDDLRLALAKSGGQHPDKRFGLGAALYLAGASTAVLTNVLLERNGLTAVEIVDRASLELHASRLSDNAYGIYLADAGRLTVAGSSFEGSLANALAAGDTAIISIADSSFRDNGSTLGARGIEYDAVRVGGDAVLTLTGNTFSDNMRFALSLHGAVHAVMTDNLFENNGGYDDSVDLYSSALLVEESASVTVVGDRYRDNPGGAIEFSGNAGGTFTGVSVVRTGSFASIYSESRGAVRFTGVTVTDNEGGLYFLAGSLIIEGGTYARNLSEAVYADGVDRLDVRGATFSGNAGAAIVVYESTDVTITGNALRGNGDGIVIDAATEAVVGDNDGVD